MNLPRRHHSQYIPMAIITALFMVACNSPLYAGPQSSGEAPATNPATTSALPDAPQEQSSQTVQQPAQSPAQATQTPPQSAPPAQSSQTPQPPPQSPSGAAAAKAAPVRGAPAAEPVGAAVAPPRQHSHRSLLIKAGLLAGAGVALGSVVALSERSPTRPPGTGH